MPATWPTPLLQIDGEGRPAADGWTFPTRDPATGEVLAHVPDGGAADMDAAVEAAHKTFHATVWSDDDRLRWTSLQRLHALLAQHHGHLRGLMTAETGMPVSLTPPHLDEPLARMLDVRDRGVVPGVVAVITPMTSPLSFALDTIAPVLSAGGTVVLKPAPDAAWTALELGRIAAQVLPRGVLNVVASRDVDVAIALTTDPRVDEVFFAGCPVNAERVRVTATQAGKRVRIDVGGPSAPLRVGPGDDLEAVVSDAAARVCAHAGQVPRLPAAVVVPAGRYSEAVRVAVRAVSDIKVGDPTDPATVCGPLVSPVQRDRVLRYLALARSEGGHVETGGLALARRGGWWVAPTVVSGLDLGSRVVREEILGPVLLVVSDRS
ncbi:MAG: Aldehyde dehydrogenase [uncultured Nocardioides sp.]|uniref:Aldehyde dehydrogenase n=1 Tax=uncultured Nocardioides sp. TaxID=198441 RepID=A0A6J4N0H5_9ACTN|nr:MAG: Aldehyde dehydrogenase [uncultured Nocardioides sp.]